MATAAAGPKPASIHALLMLKQWGMRGRRALVEVIVRRDTEERMNMSV
jgi:hypothetical protein